jgi:hypothetical protein
MILYSILHPHSNLQVIDYRVPDSKTKNNFINPFSDMIYTLTYCPNFLSPLPFSPSQKIFPLDIHQNLINYITLISI